MIIYKTTHPIYSTSIPDNVAIFNTLLRLILEIHLGLALLLFNFFKVYHFLHLEIILREIVLDNLRMAFFVPP